MDMVYRPSVAVWELTMNCNMRCKHCGSGCEGPIPGELTTQEALELADALGRIGLRHITLSGGEPFTRPDWPEIAARLISHGITVAVITNGWLLDEATVAKAVEVGLCGFGISIDGTRETHDMIRKAGSFDRIMKAIDLIKAHGKPVTAVTCIHGKNLPELEAMKAVFVEKGVTAWQMQAADPMGNLLDHLDWILDPADIERIVDFAHDTMQSTPLQVHLADNIGYYHLHETEVRSADFGSGSLEGVWRGCGAGKHVLGIRCNGDIIGCLSIRDDAYIEGNIRQVPLEELWTRPGAFAWNRDLTKSQLTGRCRTCQFGARCLAGCGGMKITRFKSTTENQFCAYHCAMEREEAELRQVPAEERLGKALEAISEESFQSAAMLLEWAAKDAPEDIELLNLLGYVHYAMENLSECLATNQRVLQLDPQNAYAHKGQGIALCSMGHLDEGVASLRQAIALAEPSFTDPFYDLAVVLSGQGEVEEALGILEEGRRRSEAFVAQSEPLYRQLRERLATPVG